MHDDLGKTSIERTVSFQTLSLCYDISLFHFFNVFPLITWMRTRTIALCCMHSLDTLRMHTPSTKLFHVVILQMKALFQHEAGSLCRTVRDTYGIGPAMGRHVMTAHAYLHRIIQFAAHCTSSFSSLRAGFHCGYSPPLLVIRGLKRHHYHSDRGSSCRSEAAAHHELSLRFLIKYQRSRSGNWPLELLSYAALLLVICGLKRHRYHSDRGSSWSSEAAARNKLSLRFLIKNCEPWSRLNLFPVLCIVCTREFQNSEFNSLCRPEYQGFFYSLRSQAGRTSLENVVHDRIMPWCTTS